MTSVQRNWWWRNGSDFYSTADTALLWLCLFFCLIFLQLPDLSSCLVLVGFSLIWILDLIGLWHFVYVFLSFLTSFEFRMVYCVELGIIVMSDYPTAP